MLQLWSLLIYRKAILRFYERERNQATESTMPSQRETKISERKPTIIANDFNDEKETI